MCYSKEDEERIANDNRLNNTERSIKQELLITKKTREGMLTNDDWDKQLKRNQKSIELEERLNKIRGNK